jgi:hypothetical protein
LYVSTHWTASIVDDEITRRSIAQMKAQLPASRSSDRSQSFSPSASPPQVAPHASRTFTSIEIEEGERALAKGTRTRLLEAEKSVSFLSSISSRLSPGSVTIFAGDFNTVAGTPELSYMLHHGYHHVSLPAGSITWDTANPNCVLQNEPENGSSRGPVEEKLYADFGKRDSLLDHVFVKDNGDGNPLPEYEAKVVMGRSDVENMKGCIVPSDHLGILVLFKI